MHKIEHTIKDLLKCYSPFIVLLLTFASLRNLVPELSKHVHYTLMPNFDKAVFGTLPTITLQHLLWHGYVTWYDYFLYGFYVSHYIFPVFLAWIIYKYHKKEYLNFAMTYMLTTFSAFILFIIYPTAPPWLASQNGYIPHITRISSSIFASLGVHNFAKLYGSYAPNPVAAAPSLHTAYSVLFVLFIYKFFGKRWAAVSLIYPVLGVVYLGEHYVFDVLTGAMLAIVSFFLTPLLVRYCQAKITPLYTRSALPHLLKNIIKSDCPVK
jgi:membrane-associated phospholipid phosphatase